MTTLWQYRITISSDDGHIETMDVVTENPGAMLRFSTLLQLGTSNDERVHIEPEPFGRIDDLRKLLDRRCADLL